MSRARLLLGFVCLAYSVTCLTAQAQLANSAWPKFHANSLNTGLGVGSGATNTVKWSYGIGDNTTSSQSSPVIGLTGMVYVGSENGKVYAINSTTGALVWSALSTTLMVRSTPADRLRRHGVCGIGRWQRLRSEWQHGRSHLVLRDG